MQASLRLRAPQFSSNSACPRSTLRCCFGHENFLALRRKTNFHYSSLSAIVRNQSSSTVPAPPHYNEPSNHNKTFASVAGAAVVTIALASAIGCFCPSWSRRGRIGLALDIPKSCCAERDQISADQVLLEMFEKQVLPEKFFKVAPNYPRIKEYFEKHLRLSDVSWETLVKKWKEIERGPDQIEIGLLLIDICITKGDVTLANEIYMEIIKSPELDQRLKIRMDIVNLIKNWDKKKEKEKKEEWKNFAKKMQDIDTLFIDVPIPA